jgi:hypothetical protein
MAAFEKSVEAGNTTDTTSIDQEKNVPSTPPVAVVDEEDETQYMHGIKLALVLLGLCLAVFLVGLDNSILATVSLLS